MKPSGSDIGLFLLRVSFSGMMILQHGWKKLVNFSSIAPKFPDPLAVGSQLSLALAVLGEVIFPVMIIVGLRTRLAAVPAAITMAVAAFLVHAGDPLKEREMALVYLFAFVAIAFLGPGRISWDQFRKDQ